MRRGVCYAFAMAGLASCIADDLTEQPCAGQPQESGLYLSLQADGGMQPVVTRSAGVDALNENLVEKVDIFVFREDGTLNTGGYVHADLAAGNDFVAVYRGAGWKDNFQDGETYTLYALANYQGTDDLSQVADLDDLKEVRMTDADIVYWQGMPGYDGEKTFLMDGSVTFGTGDFPTGNQPYELEVPVKRAAVKVEVTLNFSEEWAAKFSATDLLAQATNYATVTTAFADGYALTVDQRGYATTPSGGDAAANFTDDFVVRPSDGGISGSTIRFYSYVNRWDDLATNETMMLIDLPGTLTEAGQQPQTFTHNFYKIPLISNTAEPVMERNTFYQVIATVDMLGTEEIDEPVILQNVQFRTAEWVSSTVPVGDGDSPQYLILSEYHKDIRNADGFNEGDGLEFYSSSALSEVRVATSEEIEEAIASGDITFNYPGNGDNSNVPGIFFVNKDNRRVGVDKDDPNDDGSYGDNGDDEVSVSYDRDAVEGEIRLTSTNPENVTKRYITLKVKNMDELSKYVVIEQYPLEYIQPIAGYYSYRDDLKERGGTYEEHGSSSGIESSSIFKAVWQESWFGGGEWVDVGIWASKVMLNGDIKGWYWTRNRNNRWSVTTAEGEDGYNTGNFPDNNMMYFVTITQSDPDYKIAHPLTEVVEEYNGQTATVNSDENNELISPAFMLASQLGTVVASQFTWNEAREHCANYVETYRLNGQVHELKDWRLPTSEEIKIIVKYQDEVPAVMAEVLAGPFYYVGWSQATDGEYNQPRGSASTGKDPEDDYSAAVRCIRDVKPNDAFLQNTNQ